MECRCREMDEVLGAEAEDYVAGHLRSDPQGDFVCPDTGKRWVLDYPRDGQARLRPRPA